MVNGAIEAVLWPGCKKTVGSDLLLGGIFANKPGYHNSRRNHLTNRPDDYSIQLTKDRQGPGELGSAIDLTFRSAQAGRFDNIAKYSRRLYEAGRSHDPRAYPMREFRGNIDSDRTDEGWSYLHDRPLSPLTPDDDSHLWHIHISIYRKYINDVRAMQSILSIWNGEDMPLSDGDIAKIVKALKEELFNADVVQNFTSTAAENPTLQVDTALGKIGEDVRAIKSKLQA